MTYDEAMRWWFSRVNYELQTPEPNDLKLDRMRLFLERLGNPQERLRIVHIAGSKGKGSTSAMLAAILQSEGWRVGLFTSPHLQRVEERVQVDGVPISPAELTELMAELRDAAAPPPAGAARPLGPKTLDQGLTFFEIVTALGFLHFARRGADAAVVEVGLGGRFDSTNVCVPLVSIITSISFDHTQQLGNTLANIAFEKAGIIKAGRPVISGVVQPEARDVIRRVAAERPARLIQRDVDFRFEHEPGLINGGQELWPRVRVETWGGAGPWRELRLVGEHQAANAALAVTAVEVLREQGLVISDRAVAEGLVRVRWAARLEVVGRRPLILLDCAHNVASAHALARTLVESFPLQAGGRRLLIFGGSKDKDLAGMLAELASPVDHIFLTRFASPRCTPPEELTPLLPEKLRHAATLSANAATALQQARAAARPEDLILAAGSVFLAGELRSMLVPSPA
jgi:dihydrofolate synthase/folylpolyglutamate synthase